MRNLAILLVLAGAAYLVFTQGLPKYRAHRAASNEADAAAAASAHCVASATQARNSFTSEVDQFGQPPLQAHLWTTALLRVAGQIATAYDACSCPTEACLTAGAALTDLRRLLNDIDAYVNAKIDGVADPRGRLARIDQQLRAAATSYE